VLQWFGTNTDVSELKRVEQALRGSEELYRSIGESIDYGVWICEPDGRNIYASESFLKMVGITQEQCSNFGWGNVLHPDDAERTISLWQECVRTGGTWDIEHRFRGADGQWHPVLARGVPVRNAQGKITCWAGINLDISRLKQAEEQIKTSLTEKEVLLKEVHHRVKNNLQIISSLINLQADCLADEQLQGVLSDVRNRVRTMALVHEKLYQTNDLATLNFAEYVSSLLKYLWSAHSTISGNLHLNMSLVPLILPIDMAVNCGLILNELITNALKYAFPDGREGEVSVVLEHDPATGVVCLRVRDNGVGLPEEMDWRQSASLGLRLVQMLAGQMRGRVRTGPGPGTEFQISFNVNGIPS
jgi:PAS domain S-box-containing protein